MTDQHFVEICQRVVQNTQNNLGPAIASRLKPDKGRRKDKSAVSMLFSIIDKKNNGLWNGYYTSYSLVCNPSRGVWHCRFMHHKKRKETGSGQFNRGIDQIVSAYNGQGGFHLEQSDEVFNLTQPFKGDPADLEAKLTEALTFLISNLHPRIDRVIAETTKSGSSPSA